jgi:hypothetical protein
MDVADIKNYFLTEAKIDNNLFKCFNRTALKYLNINKMSQLLQEGA